MGKVRIRKENKVTPLLITIDGPAGAGKTTVSKELASRLGYRYIDTGALYRGIAHQVAANGISPSDDSALERLCAGITLDFKESNDGLRLICNGRDITDEIRTPEITMLASAVSARPVVRKALLGFQRELGRNKAAVFEGRDMGTVVFPDADVKFFLTANLSTRARRRHAELGGRQTLQEVEAEMRKRDENDSRRQVAPLIPAQDAVIIDSTGLSVDQVVDKMLEYINRYMC